jgi:hypothetical protein
MPQKKQKKQKKSLVNKNKLKSSINVKINIDNSKKSTGRRIPSKATNIQPMVNFPSYQPARIQQLEPKQQFNNADFTKTMDEYQKQFKTYLETKDKDTKDMIEKFDDTLKKNIAPQKKEESKPGASNVLADNEGTVIYDSPIPSKKQSSSGHDKWNKSNELKKNQIVEADAEPFYINQLFDNPPQVAKPATIKEVVRGLSKDERKEGDDESKKMTLEENRIEKYGEYVPAYKQYYDDDNYEKDMNAKPTATWTLKANALNKKIKRFKTYENQQIVENLNKQYKGAPTYKE